MHEPQTQRRRGDEEGGRSREPFGDPDVRGAANPRPRDAAACRRSSARDRVGCGAGLGRRRSTRSNSSRAASGPAASARAAVGSIADAGGDAREHAPSSGRSRGGPAARRAPRPPPGRRRIARSRSPRRASAASSREQHSAGEQPARADRAGRAASTKEGRTLKQQNTAKGTIRWSMPHPPASESLAQTRRIHRRRELAAHCRAVHCRRHLEAAACGAGRRRDLPRRRSCSAPMSRKCIAGDVKRNHPERGRRAARQSRRRWPPSSRRSCSCCSAARP